MAIFLSFQKTLFAFGFTYPEIREFPHILYVNQYQLSIGIPFEIDTKIAVSFTVFYANCREAPTLPDRFMDYA